jgi:osmotically-inducible protein OsmY
MSMFPGARPLLVTAALIALAGCAAVPAVLVGGAVVGGGLVATDRRTAGTQLEDQGIEFRAAARVRELATLGQISVNAYNRVVLLTGEVPGAAERQKVEDAVAKVENVRGVVNELVVAGNSSLSSRSADTVLAAKVKATLVDAKDLSANAFKVVAERRVVYLMGRVTPREGERGADLASRVSGVERVVKVFETMSEAQLAAETVSGAQPDAAGQAPAPVSSATPVTPATPATSGTAGNPVPPPPNR